VDGAGSRLEGLLGDLWGSEGMSKTYVVVSSVIRRKDAKAESNRLQINEQYKYVPPTSWPSTGYYCLT
jgi:hypothetical protein